MKNRLILFTGCVMFLLAAISVVAQDSKDKSENKESATETVTGEGTAPKANAPARTSTPIALTVEAIQDLETRKQALDERELALSERSKALDLQEKLLKEKLQRMDQLKAKITERLDGFKKEHEEKIGKLVAMVEGMRPQAAAEYLESLDPELAVEVIERIQVAKVSKIMNLLDKKKGAKLSELYTGYRTAMADGVSASPASSKGSTGSNEESNKAGGATDTNKL
jgi:flagellar motility protein MotE (MotC chaperone)